MVLRPVGRMVERRAFISGLRENSPGMPETGQGDAPWARNLRTRMPRDDSGVSPVIGMILVLGISVVGIAATVYWGLPAIDEMKANVEVRTIEGQFTALDATVKELVAGTTQRTAKRWQPSMSRGEILMTNEAEAWVYAVDVQGFTSSLWYGSLADRDHGVVIRNTGTSANVQVEAFRVTGSSQEQLTVSTSSGDSTAAVFPITIAQDAEAPFYLWSGTDEMPISTGIFHIKVWEGADVISEMWYVETGRTVYQSDAGLSLKSVVANNGAVLTGTNGNFVVVNTPSTPPPSSSGGTMRFFSRAVVLDGTGSFAGSDRFDVLLSLYSTSTLASYDCLNGDGCISASKIAVLGDYKTAWYSYLTNANRGYGYASEDVAFTGGTVEYLVDTPVDPAAYTLLASVVKLGVSS